VLLRLLIKKKSEYSPYKNLKKIHQLALIDGEQCGSKPLLKKKNSSNADLNVAVLTERGKIKVEPGWRGEGERDSQRGVWGGLRPLRSLG